MDFYARGKLYMRLCASAIIRCMRVLEKEKRFLGGFLSNVFRVNSS